MSSSCCFFANLFAKFGFYIVNRKQLILFLSRFFAINIVYCFFLNFLISLVYISRCCQGKRSKSEYQKCFLVFIFFIFFPSILLYLESASKRLQDVKFPYHLWSRFSSKIFRVFPRLASASLCQGENGMEKKTALRWLLGSVCLLGFLLFFVVRFSWCYRLSRFFFPTLSSGRWSPGLSLNALEAPPITLTLFG